MTVIAAPNELTATLMPLAFYVSFKIGCAFILSFTEWANFGCDVSDLVDTPYFL
jgi:hypothetical protein